MGEAPRFRVYLVDVSASVHPRPKDALHRFQAFFDMDVAALSSDDQVAVIAFAGRTKTVLSATDVDDARKGINLDDLLSRIEPGYSRIQPAILAAKALIPPAMTGEMVLHSDGGFFDRLPGSASTDGQGIPIYSVYTPGVRVTDLSIRELSHPAQVAPGEALVVDVSLGFEIEGGERAPRSGHLAVFHGGKEIQREELSLVPGEVSNLRLRLEPLPDGRSEVTLRASLAGGDGDDFPANDERRIRVVVGDRPLALVVQPKNRSRAGTFSSRLLSRMGYRTVELIRLPLSEELDAASLLVLEDVDADCGLAFPDRSHEIRDFVSRGGGVVVLSGQDSLGPGGWSGTPLESALGVWCRPESEEGRFLVFLLDVSGSMSQESKMDSAREALRMLVGKLEKSDKIAVLPYRDRPEAMLGPTSIGDSERIDLLLKEVAKLTPRGGTRIIPALTSLLAWLEDRDLTGAHVVLISDGLDAQDQENPDQVDELARSLSERNATATLILTGEDVSSDLLSRIPDATSLGAVFRIESPSQLFKVILKDVTREEISDQSERIGVVRLDVSSEIRINKRNSWPGLSRYVRVTAKEGATVLLSTPSGDPVLTQGRFGSGRSVVFSSQPAEDWAPDYEGEESLFEAVFSFAAGATRAGVSGWIESAAKGRSHLRVRLHERTDDPPGSLWGRIETEGDEEFELPMTEPWGYKGLLPEVADRSGKVIVVRGNSSEVLTRIPWVGAPPPDFLFRKPQPEVLGRMAHASFGRSVTAPGFIPAPRRLGRVGGAVATFLYLGALGSLLVGVFLRWRGSRRGIPRQLANQS